MIIFEERAVAFIDVLGFKGLVNSAALGDDQSRQELSNLVSLLEGAVPVLDALVDNSVPKCLIPKHNYISDCIILSAPIKNKCRTNYNGLEIVIMRVIQLTHFFLEHGYLIRGGISVGKVWHTDSNIIGPAYQEAYSLEVKGKNPVVLLSESAKNTPRYNSRMCIRLNGQVFVNGLHDFYIKDSDIHGKIEETYQGYEQLVKDNLDSQISRCAKRKWKWFEQYLKAESGEGTEWAGA